MRILSAVKWLLWVAYTLFGLYVAFDFLHLPPDGLANVGVAIYAAPATVLCLTVGRPVGIDFPCMPGRFGYYGGHIVFLVISWMLSLWLIALAVRVVRRVLSGIAALYRQ